MRACTKWLQCNERLCGCTQSCDSDSAGECNALKPPSLPPFSLSLHAPLRPTASQPRDQLQALMKRQSGNWGSGGGGPARQAGSLRGWWHQDPSSYRISASPLWSITGIAAGPSGMESIAFMLTFPACLPVCVKETFEWRMVRCVPVSWVINSTRDCLAAWWKLLSVRRMFCQQRWWRSQRLKSFVIAPQSDVTIPAICWPAQHPQWVMGNV